MEKNLKQVIFSLVMCFIVICCAPAIKVYSTDNICNYEGQLFRKEYEENIFLSLENTPCAQPLFIVGVAVDKSGRFLTVCSTGGLKTHVEIYDEKGCFLRRYVFQNAGAILADFSDTANNIDLFFVREHIVLTMDEEGHYITAREDSEIAETTTRLKAVSGYSKTVNGNNFHIDMKDGKQEFTVTSKNNEIIYQCTLASRIRKLHNCLILTVSISVSIIIFIVGHKRVKKKAKS